MKIKSATFQNYRGIKDLSLEFSPKTTVLAGVNGVGKSAVLDGLAAMFSGDQIHALVGEDDIQAGYKALQLAVAVYDSDRHWTIEAEFKRNQIGTSLETNSSISDGLEIASAAGPFAHYNSKRSAFDSPIGSTSLEKFRKLFPRTDIDFTGFFAWFKDREDLENETLRDKPRFIDNALGAVRGAIERFTGFDRPRVRRQIPMRMTVQKLGIELSVNQLSDGERNTLALVGDIAQRLYLLNPAGDADAILRGEGVVLIDEIELHLHPKWQREIVSKLETTFPSCQFIVTTHSPQVLSHVHEENVWILRLNGVGEVEAARPQASFGLDSNRILENIMDVPERPQEAKDQIELLFRLLSSKDRSRAESAIASISAQYGDLPELAQARALLRRQELIGR